MISTQASNRHFILVTIIIGGAIAAIILAFGIYVVLKNTTRPIISVEKNDKKTDINYIPLVEDVLNYSFIYPENWSYRTEPESDFKFVTFYEGSQRVLVVESPIEGKGLHGWERIETKYYETNDSQRKLTYCYYKSSDQTREDLILVYWGTEDEEEGVMQFPLPIDSAQKERLLKVIDKIVSSFVFVDGSKQSIINILFPNGQERISVGTKLIIQYSIDSEFASQLSKTDKTELYLLDANTNQITGYIGAEFPHALDQVDPRGSKFIWNTSELLQHGGLDVYPISPKPGNYKILLLSRHRSFDPSVIQGDFSLDLIADGYYSAGKIIKSDGEKRFDLLGSDVSEPFFLVK